MSLPRYPEYKDSGVDWLGQIPAHWGLCALKRIATLKSGESITSEQIHDAGSYPVFGGNGMRGFTSSFTHEGRFALIGRQGALCGNVNYSHGRFWASEHAVVATPAKPADTTWLGEMLRAMNLNQYSVSAAQPGLSVEIISNIDVPYPPLDEQCAIAAFVDRETAKIDALIAEQEKLIVLLAEKRQVTISHAVTKGLNPDAPMKDSGVTWLGEVPIHWGHARKLLDLVTSHQHSFVNGPFGSDLLTSELVAEGVPIIYIRDINAMGYRRVSEWHVTREKALQLQFCNVQPGDILVAKVGDPPGVAAVYPAGEPQAIVTQDVIRLRLDADKALPRYICWLLNSRYGKTTIEQISVESTRTRVGLGEYKQLRFVVPPLPEQVSIATFLDVECARLDALTAEATRAIALLKERRSSLIAAAVTGQIDVRRT
jgi:type I restriction enzyme, S subunit